MKSFAICSLVFSDRQRKWKEELDQELERKRGRYSWFLSPSSLLPFFSPTFTYCSLMVDYVTFQANLLFFSFILQTAH